MVIYWRSGSSVIGLKRAELSVSSGPAWTSGLTHHLPFSIFIYLAMPGLSCSTWALLTAAGRIFSCSPWDLVPWPGLNPGPPALKLEVLATGPPGKALQHVYLITDCSHPIFWGGESGYPQYQRGSSGLMDLLRFMHKPPSSPRPSSKPEALSQMRLCTSP